MCDNQRKFGLDPIKSSWGKKRLLYNRNTHTEHEAPMTLKSGHGYQNCHENAKPKASDHRAKFQT